MARVKRTIPKKTLWIIAISIAVVIVAALCVVFLPKLLSPAPAPTPDGSENQNQTPEPLTQPLVESTLISEKNEEGLLYYDLYEDYAIITKCMKAATELTLPETLSDKPVMAIGEAAFSSCSALKTISLPSSLVEIGDMAFNSCTALKEVTLGDKIHKIGAYAFSGCVSLEKVEIPAGVEFIGVHAFDETPFLKNNEEEYMIAGNGILIGYHGVGGSITLPSDVKKINSLSACETLTALYIPAGVTQIGDFALAGCSNLSSVSIPESVTIVGDSAFAGCSSLIGLRLGENVESVGRGAFSYCDNLKSVNYPASVKSIGADQFELTETIETIYVAPGSYAEEFFQNTEYKDLINSETE